MRNAFAFAYATQRGEWHTLAADVDSSRSPYNPLAACIFTGAVVGLHARVDSGHRFWSARRLDAALRDYPS